MKIDHFLVADPDYGLYLARRTDTWNDGVCCPDQNDIDPVYCGEWCPFFNIRTSPVESNGYTLTLTCRPITSSFLISEAHYVTEM